MLTKLTKRNLKNQLKPSRFCWFIVEWNEFDTTHFCCFHGSKTFRNILAKRNIFGIKSCNLSLMISPMQSYKNVRFLPGSRIFRFFFKSPCSLDHSWQLLLNKVCHNLISLGGDRASMRYVVTLHTTHNVGDLYINCNGIDWDEYPPLKTKYQIPYLSTLLSPKILMELFYTKETKRTRKDF